MPNSDTKRYNFSDNSWVEFHRLPQEDSQRPWRVVGMMFPNSTRFAVGTTEDVVKIADRYSDQGLEALLEYWDAPAEGRV